MNTFVIPEEGLYHYGVLGMHWGVRRYQYKNGSLTPAGKKRYAKVRGNYKLEEKTKKKAIKILDKELTNQQNKAKNMDKAYKQAKKQSDKDARIAANAIFKKKEKTTRAMDSARAASEMKKEFDEYLQNSRLLVKKLSDVSNNVLKPGKDYITGGWIWNQKVVGVSPDTFNYKDKK